MAAYGIITSSALSRYQSESKLADRGSYGTESLSPDGRCNPSRRLRQRDIPDLVAFARGRGGDRFLPPEKNSVPIP
jgi:hypothetical protein